MDLTIPIAASLWYFGYYLNKDGKTPRGQEKIRQHIVPNEIPSSTNTYRSVESRKTAEMVRDIATDRFAKSMDTINTNIVPEIMNCKYDCVGGEESSLLPNSILPTVKYVTDTGDDSKIFSGPMFNSQSFINTEKYLNTMSGSDVVMAHSNMQPFFKGELKQNMKEDAFQSKLESFTGTSTLYPQKKGVPSLFKPQPQATNGVSYQRDLSRYILSDLKTGLLPVPQIREIPIPELALRPQQKTLEQLYVNPKVSYTTPVIESGIDYIKRGEIGVYKKNGVATDFAMSQDRWFKGSTVSAPMMKENFTKTSNCLRSDSQNFTLLPASGNKKGQFGACLETQCNSGAETEFSNPHRKGTVGYGVRNANVQFTKPNEIERQTAKVNSTQRDTVKGFEFLPGGDSNRGYIQSIDSPDPTIKEGNLFSYTGNIDSHVKAGIDHDAKITKERQDLLDYSYIGTPGSSVNAPVNDTMYKNMNINSNRESSSDNKDYFIKYTNGHKFGAGKDQVKIKQKNDSLYLTDYRGNPTVVTNNPISPCMYGNNVDSNRAKMVVEEHNYFNRIDPILLKALETNPYNRNILE